jgi:hypothetical protein
VKLIEKKKKKNLINISKTMENKISEKLKKIYASTDLIKKADKNRIKILEDKKLKQYSNFQYSLIELKEKIKIDKQKDKEKNENINDNISAINRSFIQENKSLSNKLMDKYKKIAEKNKDKFVNLNKFIRKRQNSINHVNENNLLNKLYFSKLGVKIKKNQQKHNNKSIQRNRSMNLSRDLIK